MLLSSESEYVYQTKDILFIFQKFEKLFEQDKLVRLIEPTLTTLSQYPLGRLPFTKIDLGLFCNTLSITVSDVCDCNEFITNSENLDPLIDCRSVQTDGHG